MSTHAAPLSFDATANDATAKPLRIVILGLSITSSWGNGHATTFRGLVRELCARGHDVLFLERDVPWYSSNRDLPQPPFGRTELYESLDDLQRFEADVRDADLTIVGSYVPQGVEASEWVLSAARGLKAFYDIDTPVTLAKLARGDYEYLSPALIPRFDLYLSFCGGPTLQKLERELGSPCARFFGCSVDSTLYFPEAVETQWDLSYLGTYSGDRQPPLEKLLIEPARRFSKGRFVVAGPQYPDSIAWPDNVARLEHLPPAQHRAWYCGARWTLNITRADMIQAGFSPSVRLFEAAACGVPIISDWWEGLDSFFDIGREIIVAHSPDDVLKTLRDTSDDERRAIGERARHKVLRHHTAAHRAVELESYARELAAREK